MSLQERLHKLVLSLAEGLYEKDDLLALSLLTAIAGESIFFLGPPGVAKSMVARRLRLAFEGDGKAFEHLMNRFTTPDEIFGPVSISSLKSDKYERLTEGYLPDAQIAFLDEIFKASPSILNALLTILNEKVFHNGPNAQELPLQLLIAASNELPCQGEGLEALWDRFVVRRVVNGISNTSEFDKMLSDTTEAEPEICENLKIKKEELSQWHQGIAAVELGTIPLSTIHHIRTKLLSADGFYVSDRRWKKAVGLMKASAFCNGHSAIQLAEMGLLTDILPPEPQLANNCERIISQSLTEAIAEDLSVELLQEQLDSLRDELKCIKRTNPMGGSRQSFKKVHTFFHQLVHSNKRPILIYASEYATLSSDYTEAYILQDDRKKTGAQILKKYEKSRHPGVFPKDILQLKRTPNGLSVNGKDYPLVVDDSKQILPTEQTPKAASANPDALLALQRLAEKAKTIRDEYETLRKGQENYISAHLFLDGKQRKLVTQSLSAVDYAINRLNSDSAELIHTFKL